MSPSRTKVVYRQLVEVAPDAIIVIDAKGRIVLANRHAERMFGYTNAELVRSTLGRLIPERFVCAHALHRGAFIAEPASRPMGSGLELLALHKSGREIPVEISLSNITTRDGVLAAAAIRDISDRVRTDRALRDAEEKFRGILQNAGTGLALVRLCDDAEPCRLADVNPAIVALTGFSRQELLVMDIRELHEASSREMPERAIATLEADELPSYRYEACWLNSHQERVWVHIIGSLVRNDAGEPYYCLFQVADISERKRLEEQLRHLADHDSLTDLFNRRRFLHELDRAVAIAERYGHDGAVLLLDLDHFKYVNDSHGHIAGDSLIAHAARVLSLRLRATDTLARLGGDEFAVILADVDRRGAESVAAELLAGLRQELRADVGQNARPVTASIGITSFGASRAMAAAELLNEADIAMYDAKEAGGNRYAIYEPSRSRHHQMNTRLNWAHAIRQALLNDGFVLHAQPIRSLAADPRPRFELLVRFPSQDGDLIPPGVFLPIAERFDLAKDIDAWVTSRAVELLGRQRERGHQISLAVNLSAQSIVDDTLLRLLSSRLAIAEVTPDSLCFELTETAAISDVDNARGFAERLTEIGCEFALDDFGSGYASFYYLKHLHFDYIKIDGEFVRGLPQNQTSQVIVEAVVQIAKGLDKKTIAEFVEDEATLCLLRRAGVDYAQGYHVGMPAPVDTLDDELVRALA